MSDVAVQKKADDGYRSARASEESSARSSSPAVPAPPTNMQGGGARMVKDALSARSRGDSTTSPSEAPPETARRGIRESSARPLPHADKIQSAFGRHDVSGVSAHFGRGVDSAADNLGAKAYAQGENVAFAEESPALPTVVEEVTHVLQQREGVSVSGGRGQAGDQYEEDAQKVAEAVERGEDAEPLIDDMLGVEWDVAGDPPPAPESGPVQLSEKDESEDSEEEEDDWWKFAPKLTVPTYPDGPEGSVSFSDGSLTNEIVVKKKEIHLLGKNGITKSLPPIPVAGVPPTGIFLDLMAYAKIKLTLQGKVTLILTRNEKTQSVKVTGGLTGSLDVAGGLNAGIATGIPGIAKLGCYVYGEVKGGPALKVDLMGHAENSKDDPSWKGAVGITGGLSEVFSADAGVVGKIMSDMADVDWDVFRVQVASANLLDIGVQAAGSYKWPGGWDGEWQTDAKPLTPSFEPAEVMRLKKMNLDKVAAIVEQARARAARQARAEKKYASYQPGAGVCKDDGSTGVEGGAPDNVGTPEEYDQYSQETAEQAEKDKEIEEMVKKYYGTGANENQTPADGGGYYY